MMKYKFILLLVFATAILWSCKKITNVEVTPADQNGSLSYKLTDDTGKGLPGVKISLFTNSYNATGTSYDPTALDTIIKTDQNGVARFATLKAGNYLAVADSPMVNNVKYNAREFVQVVAGANKEKETKVTDFYGTLNVTVRSTVNNALLANIGVAAISYLKYPVYNSGQVFNVIDETPFKGVTNSAGVASLKIPSNMPYYIMIYTLNKGIIYSYNGNNYTIDRYAAAYSYLTMNPGY